VISQAFVYSEETLMAHTLAQPAVRRAPASALGKTCAIALAGIALGFAYLQIALFGFAPPLTIIAALCLVFAALILTGWPWTPLLALLPSIAVLGMLAPFLLSDPAAPAFVPGLMMVALSVFAVIGGIAATMQNYRRPANERSLPRWMPYAITALAAAVVAAALTGQIRPAAPSAGVSPEVLATFPTLTGKNFEFDQKEIRVKVGETVALRLENTDPEAHFLDIDELNVHAPIPVGQTGVALFKPTEPGTYTFYCAPHYDKAFTGLLLQPEQDSSFS
jgi:plastocyanin